MNVMELGAIGEFVGSVLAHVENVLYQSQLGLVPRETIPADLVRTLVPDCN